MSDDKHGGPDQVECIQFGDHATTVKVSEKVAVHSDCCEAFFKLLCDLFHSGESLGQFGPGQLTALGVAEQHFNYLFEFRDCGGNLIVVPSFSAHLFLELTELVLNALVFPQVRAR